MKRRERTVAEGQPLRLRQHDSFRAIDTAQLHASRRRRRESAGRSRCSASNTNKDARVVIMRYVSRRAKFRTSDMAASPKSPYGVSPCDTINTHPRHRT